jgi:phosphopantothenoylcysteine decarboxylase/phosphopantothenate--cysteine ligase
MEQILWPDLEGKRVLLAVSGGIAAYKAAEICRLLRRCGAEIDVMMTEAARRFVGEITFAALSGRPVAVDLFDAQQEAQIGHIKLADQADLLLVAPATANILAKLSRGIADDLVSTVYLAYRGPVLLAPAMNVNMWEHAATQENVARLRERGHRVVGPESGDLACGHVGAGRMAEPEEVLQAVGACLGPGDLVGRTVLVTAGPTHEAIDPVRYLGNRSSGRMGFALAAEAVSRGARVFIVAGPTALPTPLGAERRSVTSAAEMGDAVRELAETADVVLMAAAVADFRPARIAATKLKKEALGQEHELALTRNEDILAGLGRGEPRPTVIVGFAAETGAEELDRAAPKKLAAKGCDLLVGNDVSSPDAGFEVETNRVVIFDRSGTGERLPLMGKRAAARRIVDRVVELLRG